MLACGRDAGCIGVQAVNDIAVVCVEGGGQCSVAATHVDDQSALRAADLEDLGRGVGRQGGPGECGKHRAENNVLPEQIRTHCDTPPGWYFRAVRGLLSKNTYHKRKARRRTRKIQVLLPHPADAVEAFGGGAGRHRRVRQLRNGTGGNDHLQRRPIPQRLRRPRSYSSVGNATSPRSWARPVSFS